MNYSQSHLLQWLKRRPCLSLQCLEDEAQIPMGTLRHFVKERRDLPIAHYNSLSIVLEKYGFVALGTE